MHSVLATNGLLYIGGQFQYVGPTAGTGGAYDLLSAAPAPGFPKTDGAISTALPDGQGGWFVGGRFQMLGGHAIANLAHIHANSTVDTNWAPNPDGAVFVMIFGPLGLYVGGSFTRIGGEDHLSLAALNPASGAVSAWRADATNAFGNPSVNALALSGDTLYVGGAFAFINGVARWLLGAVQARTGDVLPWFPNDYNTQGANRVDAIVVSDGIVYVGGTFTLITRPDATIVSRNYLAAFDADTAELTPWNPNANGPVTAFALTCDKVYVAGSFTQIGGVPRNRLATLDLQTGAVGVWNPNANGPVRSLVLAGQTVFVGGIFTEVGGQPRDYLASLDLASGLPRTWTPKGDFDVSALAVSGNSVFAGGRFSAGGQQRRNVGALDPRTGRLTPWNPEANGVVRALAATASTVYLGGEFTSMSGQPRHRLAAVDALTGVPTSWDPNPSGIVRALTVAGGKVYVGGSITLTNVGGQARNRLAALDIVTGAATAWNPNANDEVDAILVNAGTVYVGGRFTRMGGQVRRRLAALDAATGAVRSWDPSANDQVNALTLSGDTVLAAGLFQSVGGQTGTNLVALDAATGLATAWNPNPHFDIVIGGILRPSSLNAVAVVGSTVYIGGFFDHVGSEPRAYLAALSAGSPGAALSWRPEVDSFVNALAAPGDGVIVGGNFNTVAGQYRPHLAVFPLEGAPRIVRHPASQQVGVGKSVSFLVEASGAVPLASQWQRNGVNVAGATSPSFTVAAAQVSDSGEYSVVVTNTLGLINSRSATLTVIQPLTIVTQPMSQTVAPGTTVIFTVVVAGNPPPTYQWRLNGVNIPGAVYPTLTITNAQPTNGGSYSVVAANVSGAISSDPATLVVTSPALPFADSLAGRGSLSGSSGVGSGSNAGATKEAGETNHVGKVGGKSVWVSWTPSANGIATFGTRGSSFDTLLAIYTGTTIANLVPVAADEDRGGFLTSEASFNATAGTQYLIAIDGFAAASGNIVLSWSLDTSTAPFPRILTQPLSQTVTNGATVTFTVVAFSPTPLAYQWFHECRAIEGATNAMLTIRPVGRADVGAYRVVLRNASSFVAVSFDAFLEIGRDPKGLSQDKLEDLLAGGANLGGFAAVGKAAAVATLVTPGFVSVSVGAIDAQLFDNTGATTQDGETNHCGVLGGASRWFGLRAEADAEFLIDTIGSRIDTVLAVYRRTNLLSLHRNLVACDNNGAPDGIRSRVRFTATTSRDYLVVVDGVNAAQGPIALNWRLGRPPAFAMGPPSSHTIRRGQGLSLRADTSVGFAASQYQWLHDGSVVVGATNATLVLGDVQVAHAGAYSVIASNDFGSTTNLLAVVTVEIPYLRFEPGPVAGVLRLWLPDRVPVGLALEESADLARWTLLLTNPPSAPAVFLDVPVHSRPWQFFRARP